MQLNDIAAEAFACSRDAGWHERQTSVFERLALVHSEVSEALEAVRRHGVSSWYEDDGKPEGVASELADVIIRVGELSVHLGVDLEAAVTEKLAYNRRRTDVPAHGSTAKSI